MEKVKSRSRRVVSDREYTGIGEGGEFELSTVVNGGGKLKGTQFFIVRSASNNEILVMDYDEFINTIDYDPVFDL